MELYYSTRKNDGDICVNSTGCDLSYGGRMRRRMKKNRENFEEYQLYSWLHAFYDE